MIRLTLLTLFCLFLAAYAWKNWYRATCGLVVLMAVLERPDMPKSILGITGMNPWNLVMLSILMAWFFDTLKRTDRGAPMPGGLRTLYIIFVTVIIASAVRLLQDITPTIEFAVAMELEDIPTAKGLFIDRLINSLKFLVPGFLFYQGCRTRKDLYLGISAILLTIFLLAIQVIKWMPLSTLLDGVALSKRALRVLDREVGYHRIDLAAMLAAGSWAFAITAMYAKEKWLKLMLFGGASIAVLGLTLTGGRAGYLTWLMLGFIFATVRWRRQLVFVPFVLIIIVSVVPAARDRLFEGTSLDESQVAEVGVEESDVYAMTSGRNLAWPKVIDKIKERPLVGYGRMGMQLSGASLEMVYEVNRGAVVPHPHNAYLEMLIDNGLLGALPVFALFVLLARYCLDLVRDKDSMVLTLVGGFGVAFVVGQLIAGMSAQSFYPREGVVIMWCVIGLVTRTYAEQRRLEYERKPRAPR